MASSKQTHRASRAQAGSKTLPFHTRIDLGSEERASIVALLNERLADSFDLFSQTKHAHWNVKGRDFYQLHLLFDQLAETIEEHVDTIAERATALGGVANGTVRMASSASSLDEMPPNVSDERPMLDALIERYAAHAKNVREAIDEADDLGDKATADVFTEICRDVDQALYFLESHVQSR